MYALVLREGSNSPLKEVGNSWIKVYDLSQSPQVDGNSGNDGTPPDFSWVPPGGIEGVDLIGYEASFSLANNVTYTFEAHINIDDGTGSQTSSTGKKQGKTDNRITVNPVCDPTAVDITHLSYENGTVVWETAMEDHSAGFNVWFKCQLVESKGDDSRYVFKHCTSIEGIVLEEVDARDGRSTFYLDLINLP